MVDIVENNNYAELYNYLAVNKFKHLSDHNEIIYYATIYKFVNKDDTAGFVWLYNVDDGMYNVHMHIHDDYKGRTLTRHVVNKFYEMTSKYAAVLIADPIDEYLIKLYKRIGWKQTSNHSSEIKLPYKWRKKYVISSKKIS